MTPQAESREIIRIVAEGYGVPVAVIMSPRKTKPVVEARWAAIRAVALLKPWLSTSELGSLFGRDYTTILYVLERLTSRRPTL